MSPPHGKLQQFKDQPINTIRENYHWLSRESWETYTCKCTLRAKVEFLNVRHKGDVLITVFLRDKNQVVDVYKLKCVSILCKHLMRTDRQD
jgi:hypothetical protein